MNEDTDRLHQLRTMPYDEYLQTPEWLERREQALDRAERRCQICYTPDNLNVHHRTYERRGNERPSDLTVLCERHHYLFHLSERIRKDDKWSLSIEEALIATIERHTDQKDKYSTGYEDIDRLLCEWRRGSFYVVAGFPQSGKTNMLLNFATASAQNGKHTLLISLEMDTEAIVHRLLASHGDVDLYHLQRGRFYADELEASMTAANTLAQLPLSFLAPTITTLPALILQIAEHEQRHGPIDMLVIDNLNMIEPDEAKKETTSQHAQSICRGLKSLAKQYNIPIIASCPLTTSRDRHSYYVNFQDIRNSGWGATEVYADTILALYRDETYDPDTLRKNLITITALRNRQGPLGEATLIFLGDRAIIRELEMLPPSEEE